MYPNWNIDFRPTWLVLKELDENSAMVVQEPPKKHLPEGKHRLFDGYIHGRLVGYDGPIPIYVDGERIYSAAEEFKVGSIVRL